jgi:hypothetical protein
MQKCDCCGKDIQEVDLGNGLELADGKCLKFKDDSGEYFVVRCDSCFEKDKSLSNYKKIETYTRCCGYYRPIQSFNKGKQQEVEERKEFTTILEQ